MAGGVTQRYERADFLNVGSSGTAEYAFMGAGFTQVGNSPSAQTSSKRYVSDKSENTSITGYAWTAPITFDVIEEEKAVEYILSIGEDEVTGGGAETDYVRVYTNQPIGTDGEYFARKRRVAVEVASIDDNNGELQGSGNLLSKSDWVKGKFNLSTRKFTPEED